MKKTYIKKLAKQSILSKNSIFPVVAIILCIILFMTLFTSSAMIKKNIVQSQQMAVGSSARIASKPMSESKLESLKKENNIKNLRYSRIIGVAKTASQLANEIRFAQDSYARDVFAFPEKGSMPEKENELAASSTYLKAEGYSSEIGSQISLRFLIAGEWIQKDFTLVGTWENPISPPREMIWVSPEFAEKIIPPVRTTSELEKLGGQGLYTVAFDLKDDSDAENYVADLSAKYSIALAVNPANSIVDTSLSKQFYGGMLILILLIFAAGGLLIYNIFYISILRDLHLYGLLKTLGASNKDLRELSLRKILYYLLLALPAGIGGGLLCAKVVVPQLRWLMYVQSENMGMRDYLGILTATALFTLLTVALSVMEPLRKIQRLAPIESLRLSYDVSSAKLPRSAKRIGKISPWNIAKRYATIRKKSYILVILSMGLSLILLNSTYTFVRSFSMEDFIKERLPADLVLSSKGRLQYQPENAYAGIDPKIFSKLQQYDMFSEKSGIYSDFLGVQLQDEKKATIIKEVDKWPPAEKENFLRTSSVIYNGQLLSEVYSMEPWAFEKLSILKGKPELGKNEIWVSQCTLTKSNEPLSLYQIGDTIVFPTKNGAALPRKVVGIVQVPTAMHRSAYIDLGQIVLVSTEDYELIFGPQPPKDFIANFKDNTKGQQQKAQNDIRKLIQPQGELDLRTIYDFEQEFEKMKTVFLITGMGTCLLLAVIGLVNFLNIIVASAFERKRELALLEIVGMTLRNRKKLCSLEGAIYGLGSMVLSGAGSIVLGETLLKSLAQQMSFFEYRFTLLPVLLSAFPIALITMLLPLIVDKVIAGASPVETLKE